MKNFLKLDWLLVVTIVLLLGIGLMALYSVSFASGSSDLGMYSLRWSFGDGDLTQCDHLWFDLAASSTGW